MSQPTTTDQLLTALANAAARVSPAADALDDLRQERNRIIVACRDAGITVATICRHAGLTHQGVKKIVAAMQ